MTVGSAEIVVTLGSMRTVLPGLDSLFARLGLLHPHSLQSCLVMKLFLPQSAHVHSGLRDCDLAWLPFPLPLSPGVSMPLADGCPPVFDFPLPLDLACSLGGVLPFLLRPLARRFRRSRTSEFRSAPCSCHSSPSSDMGLCDSGELEERRVAAFHGERCVPVLTGCLHRSSGRVEYALMGGRQHVTSQPQIGISCVHGAG